MKNLRGLFSRVFSVAAAAVIAAGCALSAYAADTSDVDLDTSEAISVGNWGTSTKYQYDTFDTTRMTKDSEIKVEFSMDTEANKLSSAPIELVFQSWESPDTSMAQPDGSVWAKVAAAEFDKSTAVFKYDDIVKAYGTDNFEKVSCICFTATDVADITVKKVTVTNCIEKGSHYVDKEAQKEEQKEKNKNNMIFTIIGIVAGVVIAVVIIVVIMNKKSSSAYDVASGEFVSKKDAKN